VSVVLVLFSCGKDSGNQTGDYTSQGSEGSTTVAQEAWSTEYWSVTATVTDVVREEHDLEFTYRLLVNREGPTVAFNPARAFLECHFWDKDGKFIDFAKVWLFMSPEFTSRDVNTFEQKCKVSVPVNARSMSVRYGQGKPRIDGIDIPAS
jgi:hypothetical protein